ncbi:enhancer of mRNA-decapping protein 3-like [Salvelinus namaycush]|uniref:Enhancer of mRNA-decapping protein 3-like n=1 Tax=Salvelinus namaycush TaxID=8040 RepID=A0A8U1HAG9_SALNM|nr:enhancer of mRNA-decapping protein 3-like [Salvelinus namaycush]
MAADWLGSLVSINCGETLGVYQGEVSSVDQSSQTISLKQPFHNGVKCPVPEVTFSAMDIKELKVLDIVSGRGVVVPKSSDPVSVPHRGQHKTQDRLSSPQQLCSKSYGDKHLDGPGQPRGFRRRHNSC